MYHGCSISWTVVSWLCLCCCMSIQVDCSLPGGDLPVQTWQRPDPQCKRGEDPLVLLGTKTLKKYVATIYIYIYTYILYMIRHIHCTFNRTYITYISYLTRTHSPTFLVPPPPPIFSQVMLRGHTKSASSKNPPAQPGEFKICCVLKMVITILKAEAVVVFPWIFFHWKFAKKKEKKQVSC